ncbi:MAG: ATP-binding protein [Chloroflexota bacterium]
MIKKSDDQGLFSKFRSSLRTWLTAYILLIALIPALAVSISNFIIAQRNLNQQAALRTAQNFERVEIITEKFLAQFPEDILVLRDTFPVQAIFRSVENGGVDPASQDSYGTWVSRLTQTFTSLVAVKPEYQQIRLLDENGAEIARVDFYDDQILIPWEEELINSGQTDYFQETKELSQGQIHISSIQINDEYPDISQLAEPIMRYSTPVYNNRGEFKGVITTSTYASQIVGRLRINERSSTTNSAGYIFANSDGSYIYDLSNSDEFPILDSGQKNIFNEVSSLAQNLNGENSSTLVSEEIVEDQAAVSSQITQRLDLFTGLSQREKNIFYFDRSTSEYVALQQIHFDGSQPDRHFKLLYTVPQNEILGITLYTRLIPYLLFGFLVAAIATFSGFALARNISKPILAISRAATSLAEMSIDKDMQRLSQTLLEVDRDDEIGNLEVSFNQMAEILSSVYVDLEQRIEEQNRVLGMLTISGQMSERITTILDEKELLDTALATLKEQFNLYHVAILLLDEDQRKLNFAFGSDEQSQRLIESRESIALDHPSSLVARAAQQRQVVLVNDVSLEPKFLAHPQITKTKSELSIPLMVHNELLGVLDIQENEKNRFEDNDVSLFVSIGRQLAIAIDNAKLFDNFQKSREQLTVALDNAVQSDKAKDEFVARVSHELRTPLGVILGNAEMIQDEMYGDINEDQFERLDDIIDSSAHLTELVNQLLDSSKLDSGKIEPRYQKFDLYELSHVVQKQMKSLAKQKQIDLNLNYDESLPDEITSDPLLIRQMIINLVGNAIKFTEVGDISINLLRKDHENFSIIVTDSGIGIPAKYQQTVFEPFRQVDGSKTRNQGGTGLGLSITKRMAEILGGTIELKSKEGVGSQFTITLPFKKTDSSALQPVKKQSGLLPEFEQGSELEPIVISDKKGLK